MNEPWNARVDDERKAETLPTFIIFCEDEVSEPIYFKYFETDRIKVNPVKKQYSKMENVIKAIAHCISEDLMEHVDGKPKLKAADTQVWCVFDLDVDTTADAQKQLESGVAFNAAIDTALSAGIKVAVSNDAFELWVLMHFQDVDPGNNGYHNRQTYYTMLTDYFKNHPSPNEDLIKALTHNTFGYKRDLKQAANFRSIVRSEMIGNTLIAIERSRTLEAYHAAQAPKPNHQKAPFTLVHHLVSELIRLGGKTI